MSFPFLPFFGVGLLLYFLPSIIVYAENYLDKSDDFVRVSVADGKVERLFSLKEVPRGFDPWESWVGLGPGGRGNGPNWPKVCLLLRTGHLTESSSLAGRLLAGSWLW